MAIVVSIHAGKVEPLRGTDEVSAIRKIPITGPVRLGMRGIEGDSQADLRHHGDAYKALCAYCSTYYTQWREYTGQQMPIGSFGENLALEGIGDWDVCVGDVYTMGDTRMEVTGPRAPCSTLAAHWGSRDMHLKVKETRMTGFYLRVLRPGVLEAGMELALAKRPMPRWTLPEFWDGIDGLIADRVAMRELLELDGLDESWRRRITKMLAAPANPSTAS